MSRRIKNTKLRKHIEKKREYFQIYQKGNIHLDLFAIYGNKNPVIMEIGIGRGEFLAGQSLLHWQNNYLGLEINKARIDYALRQLDTKRHQNVRIIDLFADENLIELIKSNTIRKIYILHPDPWPKRRHQQRRIINHKFIDVLYQLLDDKGVIEIQTDHQEYAEWILQHFSEREDFIPVNGGITDIPRQGHLVTYFEEKKMREGNNPLYITYKKKLVKDTREK